MKEAVQKKLFLQLRQYSSIFGQFLCCIQFSLAHDTGWDVDNIVISDDAIRHIIKNYTSEQGVRQLQRELTAILRRALLENNAEDVRTEFSASKIDELLSVRQTAGFSKKIGFGVRA